MEGFSISKKIRNLIRYEFEHSPQGLKQNNIGKNIEFSGYYLDHALLLLYKRGEIAFHRTNEGEIVHGLWKKTKLMKEEEMEGPLED